jgi:hypothetical protein
MLTGGGSSSTTISALDMRGRTPARHRRLRSGAGIWPSARNITVESGGTVSIRSRRPCSPPERAEKGFYVDDGAKLLHDSRAARLDRC